MTWFDTQHYSQLRACDMFHSPCWGPVQVNVTHSFPAELYKCDTGAWQTCSGLCWLTLCRDTEVRCHSSAFSSKDITETDYLAGDWAVLIIQSGCLVQIYPIISTVIQSEVTVCCDSPVKGLGLWWIVVITVTLGGSRTAGDNLLSALPVTE